MSQYQSKHPQFPRWENIRLQSWQASKMKSPYSHGVCNYGGFIWSWSRDYFPTQRHARLWRGHIQNFWAQGDFGRNVKSMGKWRAVICMDSYQGCGAGAGAGAGSAGADTFWSEPEPKPEPPKRFARSRSRSRSRSRKKTGRLRLRKGIQLWKNNGMLTAK